MSVAVSPHPPARPNINAINRVARGLVIKKLSSLERGQIVIRDAAGEATLGNAGDLTATLNVHHPRVYRQALLGGRLAIAASYLRGEWDCDDLTALFRVFIRNSNGADQLEGLLARATTIWQRLYHRWNSNSKSGSRRNIHAHYDLGNDFFQLWLDDTLAYSSGIFVSPQATLEEASIEKFDRICRKLDLRASDHLLEIGTGWGGFAIHAATHYGCRVTTTTISDAQFHVARKRVTSAGLNDRIQLLQQDYRDLDGRYDKLASIEMIEAVGHEHLEAYFKKCSELLKDDGTLVIQAIVMPEQGYRSYLNSVDFIQHYVFPGGCLPTVGAMLDAAGCASNLRMTHLEDFAPHYAETLRRWRKAFENQISEVRNLGYGEEFLRLWNYYLCYCEAAFEERSTGVVQIQFDKPGCLRDPLQIGERATISLNDGARRPRSVGRSDDVLSSTR